MRTGLIANLTYESGEWQPRELWHWKDKESELVFMGDYIDKGPSAKDTLALVRSVQERFPEHVTALLGNHELNLLLDRGKARGEPRYFDYTYGVAHPLQYMDWLPPRAHVSSSSGGGGGGGGGGSGSAGGGGGGGGHADATTQAMDAITTALQRAYDDDSYPKRRMVPDLEPSSASLLQLVEPASLRPLVSRELRRWQAAYLRGVSPRSGFGEWLQNSASLTHVSGGTLFVHGGLEPTLALAGGRLSSVDALRRLNARWWNVSREAAARVPHGATVEEAEAVEEAALAQWAHLSDASSLVEYRGLHAPGARGCERVRALLQSLRLSRIAVGHTPGNSVRTACNGQLLALDSALGRNFRKFGNMHCDPRPSAPAERACAQWDATAGGAAQCEGQIVRLARTAGPDAAAAAATRPSEEGRPAGEGAAAEARSAAPAELGGVADDGWRVLVLSAAAEDDADGTAEGHKVEL